MNLGLIDEAGKRLKSLGATVDSFDSVILNFIAQKVENHICIECNVQGIPQKAKEIAVDMIAGEFLLTKKATGQLKDFDIEAAVKSVKLGDTDVTYDTNNTPEKRLDNLINYLMCGRQKELLNYRCLKW